MTKSKTYFLAGTSNFQNSPIIASVERGANKLYIIATHLPNVIVHSLQSRRYSNIGVASESSTNVI